jgi:20S proteasome alpha/beta subunit
MYLTRSEYDRGVNTFSPEGRLFQVEYAIEAIKLGSTAIGLQTNEGCILCVEKRLTSPLLDPSSVEKIAEIDVHVGAAMSGLVADARTLVDHARVEAQNHTFTYDEPIGVEALTQGKSSSCYAVPSIIRLYSECSVLTHSHLFLLQPSVIWLCPLVKAVMAIPKSA